MKRIAIGQAGGPTAVMNASLVAFLKSVQGEVFVVANGFEGLVKKEIHPLTSSLFSDLLKYEMIPGACLKSGRYQLSEEDFQRGIENLRELEIDTLVFIGGNGTMWTLQELARRAGSIYYPIQVIGIPKTVDNDLGGTNHAPGFGSAAKYVATSVRDISKDLEAMQNFEKVRVIETMGRNVGWLAAASGLLKRHETDGPHFIYVPERSITASQILNNVSDAISEYGFATIVVSEGVKIEDKPQIEKAIVSGRVVLGGISKEIANLIQDQLGWMTRDENLGMNQRSCGLSVSFKDRAEAMQIGKVAAELVKKDDTNVMVSLNLMGDEFLMDTTPLQEVADFGERVLPNYFINDKQHYYNWLSKVVGDEIANYPSLLKIRG